MRFNLVVGSLDGEECTEFLVTVSARSIFSDKTYCCLTAAAVDHWKKGAFTMILVGLALNFAMSIAHASVATPTNNQELFFQVPAGWNCNLERAEWVCRSTSSAIAKSAVMVIAAKVPGAKDSLASYLDSLKNPRPVRSSKSKRFSKPEFAKEVRLGGQAWINARHYESEISGFTTEYLATVGSKHAYLVTLSARKAIFPKVKEDLWQLADSIHD